MTDSVAVSELLKALIGVLFVAIGIVSLGLAAMMRHSGDRSLLWFAVFTIVYGLRLTGASTPIQIASGIARPVWDYWVAFLSYAILVPVGLLANALLGSGWRSALRLFPWAAGIAGAACIVFDVLVRRPEGAIVVNRVLVVVGFALITSHLLPRVREASVDRLRPILWAGAVFAALALYETLAPNALVPGFDLEPLALLGTVVAVGHYSASRVLTNEARLAAIGSELAMARRIQQSILPRSVPVTGELSAEARYVPMTDVAGDFYEFVSVDGSRLALLVADVSGHGVPAAIIASMVKVAVAAHAHDADDPSRMLEAMNRTFLNRLETSFITAAYVVIDSAQGTVTYSSAGHPPALLLRSTGEIEQLTAGGMMLGFMDLSYPQEIRPFDRGDRLLLYTDGLTEAVKPDSGEFFGDRELTGALAEQRAASTRAFADALLARVQRWAVPQGGSLGDDLTFVVVDRRA